MFEREATWKNLGREYRFRIEMDSEPESPREWDNLGVMVTWHRRYNLGDEQPTCDAVEWLEEWKDENPHGCILPLYLYDHSGLTMSTGPFECPWDSGQVGWIYMTTEMAQKNAIISGEMQEVLENEVMVYDQYLRGDVYGFILESRPDVACTKCGRDHDWDNEDSCYGFFGDPSSSGMFEHIEEQHHQYIMDAFA